MMSTSQIFDAAGAISAQLRAGIPMVQVVNKMIDIQPGYADFWVRAARHVESGSALSEVMAEVWPEAMVSVVATGEASGKMPTVFAGIERAAEERMAINRLFGTLAYPLIICVLGVLICLGYATFVLPGLADVVDVKASHDTIFVIVKSISKFMFSYWPYVFGIIGASAVAFASWVVSDEGREWIGDMMLTVPMLDRATLNLAYALFAEHMAMMCNAGVPLLDALRLAAPVLPSQLRESVLRLLRDLLDNISVRESVAPQEWEDPDDPRRAWPIYLTHAFDVGEQTGEWENEFQRIVPSLRRDGEKILRRFVFIANSVAIGGSAALVLTPLGIFYWQIFAMARQV